MRYHILPMLALAATLACAAEPVIDQADVTRILSGLSADSLRGRRAFTPDADRAAALVAREFADIGLTPLPGAEGYLQPFAVYTVDPRDMHVTLNGQPVSAERVTATMVDTAFTWQAGDDITVKVVGPDDDLREALGALRRLGGNALVLIHPTHQALFARLRASRARTFALGDGPNIVYVLSPLSRLRSWSLTAHGEAHRQELANVTGTIPGRRPNEIVLFSGHYDHLGIRPAVNGDSIANGANDDASGVTAVIALARYFQARGRPERTLMFVAFTAEEVGGYGSRYFSQQLDPDQIVAMFNIEMIGKVGKDGPNSAWITGFDRSTFGTILQQAVEGTAYTFGPDPYPDQNLFYRSDNATLARLGVPAHSISTTPIDVDQDYHQVSDEIGTLDLTHMTNTIRAIAAGAATIVSGNATPTRVDPATVN